MAKISQCSYYILYIRDNREINNHLEIRPECFSNSEDMLNRIDTIAKEYEKQEKTFVQHIDYDYVYFF